MKLFLDDERQPQQCYNWMKQRIGDIASLYKEEWVIVKNYDEFKEALSKYGKEIEVVSFDHDLASILITLL